MEAMRGGDLWSLLYERGPVISRNFANGFTLEAVRFYSANVVLMLEFLRSKGIVYRDLKAENLMLDHTGYLKLVDFGFAKELPYRDADGNVWDKTFTMCGTPDYVAPEIALLTGYDHAIDLWALGCLVFEMYSARTPFEDDDTAALFLKIIQWTQCRTPFFKLRSNPNTPVSSTTSSLSKEARIFFGDSVSISALVSEEAVGATSRSSTNASPRSSSSGTLWEGDRDKVVLEGIVSQLMAVNPALRLGNKCTGIDEVKEHSFFSEMNWDELFSRSLPSPYVPQLSGPLDCAQFESYDEQGEDDGDDDTGGDLLEVHDVALDSF